MELEKRITKAGNTLSLPPPSLDELLLRLDRTDELLSRVEESPTKSMLTVLSPLMETLIAEEFMQHSDVDVKVGVASCISEIVRITAPDAPYDDDKMKEVFHLIVSCFEDLSDTSSRSYLKRVTILETTAKVRYCVIMLDLEMDQVIIEMFQHLFRYTRVHHPETVIESMEAVMSFVLEESGDISLALLTSIVAILKQNNEEALSNAKKLAEKVIQNGEEKLRSYLKQASKILDQESKDGTDSIYGEYRIGQSEIIDSPTTDDGRKGPKIHWDWKIVEKPSYRNCEWLIEELIRRYCGRKATNPYAFVSTLMKEEVLGGRAATVLRLMVILMDWIMGSKMNYGER